MDEVLLELVGTVEAVTFRNADNGFSVLELESDGEYVTAVGVFSDVYPGESLVLQGRWDEHSSFGRQFRVSAFTRHMPSNSAELLKYLSAGTIKGIGPATALKIVEAFGDNAFEVLESQPERLAAVKGISRDKAISITEQFNAQFAMREIMLELERCGMTASECIRAYRIYGVNAAEMVKSNPYVLCTENIGIGFERADNIARTMSSEPDSSMRAQAAAMHIIRHNVSVGHTCLPVESLAGPAAQLGISPEEITSAADRLIEGHRLVEHEINGRRFVFEPSLFNAELRAAQRITVLCKFPPAGRTTLLEDIKRIESSQKIEYEELQREAIITAAERGILILTGGPGTGKTTALRGILELFERDGLRVKLAAPTGRAAKRMTEITGREAKTIHRLLEVEWDADDRPVFTRNSQNPLEADALIVDELSMVDSLLFASLLDALPLGCRLIMVGDSDQLPPVGPGNVLHELIGSGCLPVVRLTQVFRQARESLIVMNAHRIVAGEQPLLDVSDRDFFFLERKNSAHAVRTVAGLCASRLPEAYGFSPLSDIQVLCPSRKGNLGTVSLNQALQSVINPPSDSKNEITVNGVTLREGDKVMQVKNNYNITWEKAGEEGSGIFNGDIGVLEKIQKGVGSLSVRFDEDRIASYAPEDAADLELAYAVTVHKSQGNEFEAVILPIFGVVPQLCYRNLFYTAVTRAKRLLIVVGSREQIIEMVNNNKKTRRYSALKSLLAEMTEDEA